MRYVLLVEQRTKISGHMVVVFQVYTSVFRAVVERLSELDYLGALLNRGFRVLGELREVYNMGLFLADYVLSIDKQRLNSDQKTTTQSAEATLIRKLKYLNTMWLQRLKNSVRFVFCVVLFVSWPHI